MTKQKGEIAAVRAKIPVGSLADLRSGKSGFQGLAAGILAVASSAFIFNTLVRNPRIPFAWDSAGHAWEGLIIARDILNGDLFSFAADTWRQAWWPFFHSWLLAPAFIFFGNTYMAARSLSLICFFGFVLAIYFIGCELSRERGRWIGLLAVIFASTSMPLLTLSAVCMTEIPALLCCSLALLFYLKALGNENKSSLIAASLCMSAAFFTQTHLGLFLISAILLTQATGKHKAFSRFNGWLFGPALATAILWFADPRHILLFYSHSTFQPAFYEFWSLENWLYYPKVLLFLYHSSLFAALAAILGFILSLSKFRNPAVRVLLFNIVIGLALMLLKLDHRARYIVSLVPCVWLLGSLGIVEFMCSVAEKIGHVRRRLGFMTAAGILACLIVAPGIMATYRNYEQTWLSHELWSDERQEKAYEFIAGNVPESCNHISLFTSFDYYNSLKSTTIRWNIEVQRFQGELATNERKERVSRYLSNFVRRRDAVSYRQLEDYLRFRNVNVYEYHLLSFVKALDAGAYLDLRKGKALNPFSDKIADFGTVDPRVCCLILVFRDGEDQVNRYASEFLAQHSEWQKIANRRFDDLGVTITLYHKTAHQAWSRAAGRPGSDLS
jgi:hypothetical protein